VVGQQIDLCLREPIVYRHRIMTAARSSLIASSSRPLRLRTRADLEFTRQSYQGRDYWVAKDPVSLKYFRFEEEEYALLQMLDGSTSADEIKRQFDMRFAPQKLAFSELFQFVGMLYRQSLLISGAAGQGRELQRRHVENRRRKRRASLTNILAVKIRGLDPGRLLAVLDRWIGWFFSRPMLLVNLVLMLAAAALIFSQFELFLAKLPAMQQFFAARNWLLLGLVLAVTKVCHEFGHGLTCRRLGGQCHEMGVMFLVLMPCLYCNVSDAWMLNNKWKRIAIAAAGMYVELVLASIGTFVWWFSHPGLINHLALNVMFVCSVSTILFNGNPLLRYDGYYILSDLLEVPNLRQKASRVVSLFVSSVCLGLPARQDPFLPSRNRWLFGLYSVAAVAYRWLITFTIFWFLYNLLEPYGLKLIGQLIALMAVYGLLGMPLIQAWRFFTVPGRIQAVKPVRVAATGAVALAVLTGILLIPIPHRIHCPFYVKAPESQRIYVSVPGTLEEVLVRENQPVRRGQPLARLTSLTQTYLTTELEGELALARRRLENALRRGSQDSSAANEVNSAKAYLRTIEKQLAQRRLDSEQLVITAPETGRFVLGTYVKKPSDDRGRLRQWYGYALEAKNCGAWLDQGTLLGQIIDQEQTWEAVLVVDQADVEFVRRGQQVELWSRQHFNQLYASRIDQISPSQLKQVPPALASDSGGPIQATRNAQGGLVPTSTIYQMGVPLENRAGLIFPGSTGVARIHVGQVTIGQRLWRLVCRTFHFEL